MTIAATGMAGLTVDASALSFTTTTWDTAQTVTVTAVADHARLENAQGTLTHAVAGYGAVESGPTCRCGWRTRPWTTTPTRTA